ncbi:hypothetical protein DRN85_08595 [Methanosarcinales archaeon]|nr:MAG: hypothetical protein DRN85_08595 [Methanosarcinales archaeon]
MAKEPRRTKLIVEGRITWKQFKEKVDEKLKEVGISQDTKMGFIDVVFADGFETHIEIGFNELTGNTLAIYEYYGRA